jgi:hypothetical protein
MPTIETTSVSVGMFAQLIQNLGPDPIYVGESGVTTDTGLQVSAGRSVAVGSKDAEVFVVSDGTSDVRLLGRGLGVFPADIAPVAG